MFGFRAVNARRREITEFVGDPADSRVLGLARDMTLRVQGRLVRVYRGDQSDPSQSFYGWGPQLQQFKGTGGAVNGVIYGNLMQGTLENDPGFDGLDQLDNPSMRVLANRLRTRRT
jgi:hypothetical protein